MNPFILDRPQVIEIDEALEQSMGERYLLANQDIYFDADVNADLHDFIWPWADACYARSIQIRLSAPREDEFSRMISRLYPDHMESILGDEGLIITKQVAAPLGSGYDRSVLWLLDCQAEGDRLVRVDVTIDWGHPMEQRMVDGLLVAQVNPGPTQGIYAQQNADSTRVFGNPEGRPESINLDDPQRAHLVYYLLINGEVEVQFILTVSDVGEQVAWNGFLGLREGARVSEKSGNTWRDYLRAGRLWSPDAQLNQHLHEAKITAIRSLQRLRTGLSPTDRAVTSVPDLVDAWDIMDPLQSRNLLAHLRRLGEKSGGVLPVYFPLHHKDELADPGDQIVETNAAYLTALARHLSHHFDQQLLREHYTAAGLCAAMLISREEQFQFGLNEVPGDSLQQAWRAALRAAAHLATLSGDVVNAQTWRDYASRSGEEAKPNALSKGQTLASHTQVFRHFWDCIGIEPQENGVKLSLQWPTDWDWWALMDLPIRDDKKLTLVWDGSTLHTTHPIETDFPLRIHHQIKSLHTDEDAFALEFLFIDKDETSHEVKTHFKPKLD